MPSIFLLKLLIFVLRRFTSNSATALPGLIMEKYFPGQTKKFLNQFEHVVFVTGTNGKTTTSRLICHILEQNNIPFISNTSGSNLIRGILSACLDTANIFGTLKVKTAIFEVEEATIPKLVKLLKPSTIVVTNIFRDQLDAYGEIDKTFQYIKEAITACKDVKLILNFDDDRVRSLESFSNAKSYFIGFEQMYLKMIKFENRGLQFESESNNRQKYTIANISIQNDLSTQFDIQLNDTEFMKHVLLNVPGYHNTFNAVAAILAVQELVKSGVHPQENLKLDLYNFEAAFGRGEAITTGSTVFQILLGKNPAGLNLNFSLLAEVPQKEAVLILLNDNIADGKDVSWIWDCDFSILKNAGFPHIYVGGTRGYDLALRIKYEGMQVEKVFETIEDAVQELRLSGSKRVFVLPTYTAMLQFRKALSHITTVKKIHE